MKQAISEKLKALMEQRGWNSSDLASKANLEESVVQTILEGTSHTASMQEMVALTKALGVSLNDFTSDLKVDE